MNSRIPVLALSIRQPWAWLIVNGYKDVENRQWITHFRGSFFVHASKGMTRDEYTIAGVIAEELGITLPEMKDLQRGGITAQADLVDCVDRDPSPWFFGDFGFLVKNARPLPFQPCAGRLKFFRPQLNAAA